MQRVNCLKYLQEFKFWARTFASHHVTNFKGYQIYRFKHSLLAISRYFLCGNPRNGQQWVDQDVDVFEYILTWYLIEFCSIWANFSVMFGIFAYLLLFSKYGLKVVILIFQYFQLFFNFLHLFNGCLVEMLFHFGLKIY